jgi:hypothetical protein
MVIRCFGDDLTGFVHDGFHGPPPILRAGQRRRDGARSIYLTSCQARRSPNPRSLCEGLPSRCPPAARRRGLFAGDCLGASTGAVSRRAPIDATPRPRHHRGVGSRGGKSGGGRSRRSRTGCATSPSARAASHRAACSFTTMFRTPWTWRAARTASASGRCRRANCPPFQAVQMRMVRPAALSEARGGQARRCVA